MELYWIKLIVIYVIGFLLRFIGYMILVEKFGVNCRVSYRNVSYSVLIIKNVLLCEGCELERR